MSSAITGDGIEIEVIRTLSKRIRSEYSRLWVRGQFSDALSFDFDPRDYTDAAVFSRDYLLYSLLRKWKGWKGCDPRAAAIATWTSCECSNFAMNARLRRVWLQKELSPFLWKVRHKITSVIGDFPHFAEIDPLCRWSGGATFDIRRGGDVADKMSDELTITQRALPHLARVTSGDRYWLCQLSEGSAVTPTIVDGNRCVVVAKSYKTDRMIAAEPTGNAFLQQGVGRFIRSRLKGVGIDLDRQEVNQDLAFRALVDDLSTIDLSSASDTICSNLIELLLPPAWCSYLDDLRSPKSHLDGVWHVLEKFSSMGNAFTFELESLIFWAICSSIVDEVAPGGIVSVYGDDIVVPSSSYDDVVSALNFFGFQVNDEKSYTRGSRFFESCGRHFFDLEDVTPVYQKEVCGRDLHELVRFHNRIYRWGLRNGMHLVKDALRKILDFTRSQHKKLKRLPFQPNVVGDFGFITDDTTAYKVRRDGDFSCYVLMESSPVLYRIGSEAQVRTFAYKLRNPGFQNTLPDGHVGCDPGFRRSFLGWKRLWRTQLAV